MILASTDAVAFAALAVVHGNGASAEIAEMLHLTEQVLPTQLQILQGLLHGASNLNDYKHSDYRPKKEKTQLPPTNLAHTCSICAIWNSALFLVQSKSMYATFY